jgi:hypothetical protein
MATIFIDPDNGIERPPDSIDALSGAACIVSCRVGILDASECLLYDLHHT